MRLAGVYSGATRVLKLRIKGQSGRLQQHHDLYL
jgi:hypothetical protein